MPVIGSQRKQREEKELVVKTLINWSREVIGFSDLHYRVFVTYFVFPSFHAFNFLH